MLFSVGFSVIRKVNGGDVIMKGSGDESQKLQRHICIELYIYRYEGPGGCENE